MVIISFFYSLQWLINPLILFFSSSLSLPCLLPSLFFFRDNIEAIESKLSQHYSLPTIFIYIWAYKQSPPPIKKKATKIIPPPVLFPISPSSFYQLFPFCLVSSTFFHLFFSWTNFSAKYHHLPTHLGKLKSRRGSWLLTAPWFPSPIQSKSTKYWSCCQFYSLNISQFYFSFHSYSHSPDSRFHHYSLLDTSSAPNWMYGPEEQHGS